MRDVHLMFTNLLVHAEEIGFDLEISDSDGYILTDDAGAATYCTTLGEVAEALGKARVDLLNYAEEWDRNLLRYRPA